MRKKLITIHSDQEEWIKDNYLNLSKFVQNKLHGLIDEGVEVEGTKSSQGDKVGIELDPSKIHVFDKKTGEAIINAEMGEEVT